MDLRYLDGLEKHRRCPARGHYPEDKPKRVKSPKPGRNGLGTPAQLCSLDVGPSHKNEDTFKKDLVKTSFGAGKPATSQTRLAERDARALEAAATYDQGQITTWHVFFCLWQLGGHNTGLTVYVFVSLSILVRLRAKAHR